MQTRWIIACLILLSFLGGTTLAGPAEYCNRYAESAGQRTPGPIAGALGGAITGAIPGMLLGGIFGGSKGFGRGAGIGAVIGGIGGVAKHAGAKSRAYDAAYSDCMRGHR